MQFNSSAGFETTGNDASIELDVKNVHSLTEYINILLNEDNVYTVAGQNGRTYAVETREARCTHSNYEHYRPADDNREHRKHAERVAYATGGRSIPTWVYIEDFKSTLDEHVGGTSQAAKDDGYLQKPATAGGETGDLDLPSFICRVEPAQIDGARHLRCEGYGREVVGTGATRLLHWREYPRTRGA